RPAAGNRSRRVRQAARWPARDDRADLRRLRRPDLPRRDSRRRPWSGVDARDRPVSVLLRKRGGAAVSKTAERTKQILVAGIGNAWLRDDGFGGQVAKLLSDRQLPPGVSVIDFGSGGLDLAYEVMRGYDALILLDVSRQGEPPGTLYVM